jgi:capsular polysaccharide transport system permease protein
LLPTTLCLVYYCFIASDQYEAEAHFVVRSSAKPEASGGLSFLVQLGLVKSQDDTFIVEDFITSRDALNALAAEIPIRLLYNRDGADFLARYPSPLFGSKQERFYKYYKQMVTVLHTDRTGITVLKTSAFTPEDARLIAETLLTLSERLVNQINRRSQTDAIASSMTELQTAQTRVIGAQAALTEFRDKEMTVDPQQSAVALAELIAHFSTELGTVQAQIAELRSNSARSPQLGLLQEKSAALTRQITEERSKIAESNGGLAARIASYERLVLEREFANQMLSTAEAELVRTRADAARQLLYLERIVEPNLPDYAALPKRLSKVVTVFVVNVLLLCVAWLVFSGVKEHATDGR